MIAGVTDWHRAPPRLRRQAAFFLHAATHVARVLAALVCCRGNWLIGAITDVAAITGHFGSRASKSIAVTTVSIVWKDGARSDAGQVRFFFKVDRCDSFAAGTGDRGRSDRGRVIAWLGHRARQKETAGPRQRHAASEEVKKTRDRWRRDSLRRRDRQNLEELPTRQGPNPLPWHKPPSGLSFLPSAGRGRARPMGALVLREVKTSGVHRAPGAGNDFC